MDWGEDEDALLRQLRAEGHSFTVCEQKFAAAGFPRDRNALIGRASRQKIPSAKPQRRPPVRLPQPKAKDIQKFWLRDGQPPLAERKPAAARAPQPRITNRDAAAGRFLGLMLLELDLDQCRYPEGDRDFRFCGQPTWPGASYCPFHHRICTEGSGANG